MFTRIINPSQASSFFLFGARGTGKSTFVAHQFLLKADNVWIIDLLDPDQEEKYTRHPMDLFNKIHGAQIKPDWIFIDEVQKIPKILDVVHKSIEEQKVKFILTGSSARKLKRGGANLLAGRAFLNSLYPLTEKELESKFILEDSLRWGGLPKIFSLQNDADKMQYLKTYVQTYIREEIKLEQLVRKLDPFRDFLEISAQCSGKIINFSKIAGEIGVDHKVIQNYFEILSDTWIGFYLPSFHHSIRKSQRVSPKFYYFDLGLKNSLSRSLSYQPQPGTSLFGELFEHYIINEIYRYNDYLMKDFRLSYLQTKNNAEIDLILSRGKSNYAIEIKSADNIDKSEIRKLNTLAGDIQNITQILYVSRTPERMLIDNVLCLHYSEFFRWFELL